MEPLTFLDISSLLKHTKSIELADTPTEVSEGNWELYKGQYRIHGNKFPFDVLYLQSKATVESLKQAKRKCFKRDHTHVVYAPSLNDRHNEHHALFSKDSNGKFWNTREYLVSFIKEELDGYTRKLRKLAPKYFVAPHIIAPSGITRKRPNPIDSLLFDPATSRDEAQGMLGVVLAVPGQGKTYMSEHLVSRIASNNSVFPIYVNADQWGNMSVDELGSPWKAILNSFRYFESPISWAEGHEQKFLETTLKAGLFRIIFDGFDEYVLRNRGRFSALETLDALVALVKSAGARIVVTSRSSFWDNEIGDENEFEATKGDDPIYLYQIAPFDSQEARKYFEIRFHSNSQNVLKATQAYNELKKIGLQFVGRGFVLSLIADLIERDPDLKISPTIEKPIVWLMEALCERDRLRQGLPLSAEQQLKVLQNFTAETIQGELPNTSTLDYCIASVAPNLDESTRAKCISGFISHALITRTEKDNWEITQEQVRVALLAKYLIDSCNLANAQTNVLLAAFSTKAKLQQGFAIDVAAMIVEILSSPKTDEWSSSVTSIVACLLSLKLENQKSTDKNLLRNVATAVAMKAVEKHSKNLSHQERIELLLSLLPNNELRNLHFTDSIVAMSFQGQTFTNCRFFHVKWANCEFDSRTNFQDCHFIGGRKDYCKGFGQSHFNNLIADEEAQAFISASQIQEDQRKYKAEDLKGDIRLLIDKFIGRGGIGFKAVLKSNLTTGQISESRYKDIIVTELGRLIFEEHSISNVSDKGLNIRDSAKESARFYATNNVFTGPLQEAFERLCEKLNLAD